MTADLKPCPFCGSANVEPYYSSWEYYRVDCAQCHTSGPHADLDEAFSRDPAAVEALACERWNRRAEAGVCGSVPPVTHTHRPSGSVCKAYHEQVVAEITAERDRDRADFDHLKAEWNRACTVAQQHCPTPLGKSMLFDGIPALAQRVKELEVEVERLKAEHTKVENEMLKELFIWADNWLSDEAKDQGARSVLQKVRAALAGQIESHAAHTWQQERAAVVAWLRKQWLMPQVVHAVDLVELGKHWPEGGTP